MKQVFIINGSGGVGKDTFIEYLHSALNLPVMNFSSVDKVKEIATHMGWEGTKTEKDRELLYNLKQLCTKYNDLPFRTMEEKMKEFNNSDAVILFLHIREPEEIERAKKAFSAKTLLIKRDTVEHITSNPADRDVFEYNYDVVVDTDCGLDGLSVKAQAIANDLLNNALKTEY